VILDTNAVSGLFRGDAALEKVLAAEERHQLPVIVVGEYRFGLHDRARASNSETCLINSLPNPMCWKLIWKQQASMRRFGRACGNGANRSRENDIWIGALCLQHRMALVSHDAHFDSFLGSKGGRGSSLNSVHSLVSMPKFYIKTYGCQMNERDSEQVARSLLDRGYEIAPNETEADIVLLNTCSVRDMAEQKALGKMGMLWRGAKERPEKVFGFLGCMAQARGEELFKLIPHLDLVVGTQKFHRVADHVDELVAKKRARRMDDPRFSIVDTAEEEGSQGTIREHALRPRQATAFVSIMQGCNMHCTFCIVPRTRGAERGRTIPEIVREVRELVEQGVKEVTLLGQIVNLYGRHEFPKSADKSPFVQLLEAIHEVDGLERLRFTSPHPIGFRADLIAALRDLPKLCEHVHLPLQSGSDGS
jgi:predicted nucleic acid-binding protein